MRFTPPPIEINEDEGFSFDKDIFKLEDFGKGLTNLVSNLEDPMVIAFSGQWGSGKTVFLKMWRGELKKAGFPVIYFDAYENDYVEDAFAVLAREIIELTETNKGALNAVAKGFKSSAVDLGKMLLVGTAKAATKAVVRAATAGVVSADDISSSFSAETVDTAADYLQEVFLKPKEQKLTVTAFREALSELPKRLSPPKEGVTQKPLIFIIDELDRCKPQFALAILERIKHFLSVPNVHFVLGVNLTQLRNSVKAAYGSEIDASTYLQKFINLTVTHVDSNRDAHARHITKYIEYLRNALNFKEEDRETLDNVSTFLLRVAEQHALSLRTIERIFSQVAVCLAFTQKKNLRPGPIVAGLCILKVIEPEKFAKAKTGKLRYEDVEALFGFKPVSKTASDEEERDWERDWWQICLLDEVPPRLTEFGKHLRSYGIYDGGKGVLQLIANQIVDRLKP